MTDKKTTIALFMFLFLIIGVVVVIGMFTDWNFKFEDDEEETTTFDSNGDTDTDSDVDSDDDSDEEEFKDELRDGIPAHLRDVKPTTSECTSVFYAGDDSKVCKSKQQDGEAGFTWKWSGNDPEFLGERCQLLIDHYGIKAKIHTPEEYDDINIATNDVKASRQSYGVHGLDEHLVENDITFEITPYDDQNNPIASKQSVTIQQKSDCNTASQNIYTRQAYKYWKDGDDQYLRVKIKNSGAETMEVLSLLPAKNNDDRDKELEDYNLSLNRSKSLYAPSNGLFRVRCIGSGSKSTKKGSDIMDEKDSCDKNYYVYKNSKCITGKPRWRDVSCG